MNYSSDEFVRLCQLCGYASKKNAEMYVRNKEKLGEELTGEDFEEIHRYNERKLYIEKNISSYCNYTGEQLIDNLGRSPSPWNRIFDSSRGLTEIQNKKRRRGK